MEGEVFKLPRAFLDRIKKMHPLYYSQICDTFINKKEVTFRVNLLKIDLETLKKYLNRERVRYKELSWPEGAFILTSDLKFLQKTFIYQKGLIYVQNVSSMIPVLVLAPGKNDDILDLCAAPGAKTTQLASLLGKGARIIAIDKVRHRYYRLLANLKTQIGRAHV